MKKMNLRELVEENERLRQELFRLNNELKSRKKENKSNSPAPLIQSFIENFPFAYIE